VYQQILTYVYERSLLSPEILSDVALAETLHVSRTPVRTALARLESEGLVRKVPGRGWRTLPLTAVDVEEIFDLKEMLEAHAASRAAQIITPAQSAELLGIVSDMEQAAAAGDTARERETDLRFHNLLYHIAGNGRLAQMQFRLDSQWYRLRRGHIMQRGVMQQSTQEHRLLAEAIAAGDAALAGERARQHLRRLRNNLLDIMNNIIKPFLSISD